MLNVEVKEGEDKAKAQARATNILVSFEQDSAFKVSVLKKKMKKKPSDRNLRRYYTAKARHDFIVEYLGDRSPAKAA